VEFMDFRVNLIFLCSLASNMKVQRVLCRERGRKGVSSFPLTSARYRGARS
jgi:hypothetical protein